MFLDHAFVYLNLVKSELLSANPDDQFWPHSGD